MVKRTRQDHERLPFRGGCSGLQTQSVHGGGQGLHKRLTVRVRCAAATRCRLMLDEPLLEGRVHPTLPAWPIGPKCRENIGVESNSDLLFGWILVLPTGFPQCVDRCRDSSAWRDNPPLPVDSVGRPRWRRHGLGGSDLLRTKDIQSSLGFANGQHSGTISSERRCAARSTPEK